MTGDDEHPERDTDIELFRDPEAEGGGSTAPPPGFRPAPRPLRVVAVAGAKGGVGKTLLASNFALYLATIGRRVIVVDADAEGGNVHTFLGLEHPAGLVPYVPPAPAFGVEPGPLDDDGAGPPDVPPPAAHTEPEPAPERTETRLEDCVLETPIPGLRLLHGGIDEPSRRGGPPSRRRNLLEQLRGLDAEYVVVDLGAGTQRSLLDFWLSADLTVFATLPEPTAIENTYRFVRAAFARHLRRSAGEPETRRRIVGKLRALGGAPAPLDLARRLEADGDPLSPLVRSAMDSFQLRFVLNQARLRADLELGERMRSAARRRLGVGLDYLGYVDYDDTAWSCVRARRPLLVESPGTKASRNIEKIARRLIAIDAGKAPSPPIRNVPPETHHDLLEVDRGATEEEIRRAYKRAKEVYAPDALCCYGLFDEGGLEALRARLDEAYDVLLDPARRRPYELSVFPHEPEPEDRAPAEQADEPKPPAPVITPETEFTGGLLRAVRESQGVDVRDISKSTKIGSTYLRAIEEDEFGALPAPVYVRGFVTEMAKHLRLDPEQVARTYVRRYQRFLEESGGAGRVTTSKGDR